MPSSRIDLFMESYFNPGTTVNFTCKPRWNDTGIVKHHHIARREKLRQIGDDSVAQQILGAVANDQ